MARTGRARHADAAKVEMVAKPALAALTNELVDKGIPHHVVVDEIEAGWGMPIADSAPKTIETGVHDRDVLGKVAARPGVGGPPGRPQGDRA